MIFKISKVQQKAKGCPQEDIEINRKNKDNIIILRYDY